MRKAQTHLICITLLALWSPDAWAARESISAAPDIPPADREKKTARPPKLIPLTAEEIKAQNEQLVKELQAKPDDAQLHFKLGEAFRKSGNDSSAALEFQKAIKLDKTLWVAYHQLSATCNDEKVLDAAVEQLNKLETEKPRELLLRVALSELQEKRGNYYQAARTLIDLTYANAVPEKFRVKVNARIHNMLLLSKTQHPHDEAAAQATGNTSEEDLDLLPAPLPNSGSKRSLAQAKLKDSKEVRGMGHTPLLP